MLGNDSWKLMHIFPHRKVNSPLCVAVNVLAIILLAGAILIAQPVKQPAKYNLKVHECATKMPVVPRGFSREINGINYFQVGNKCYEVTFSSQGFINLITDGDRKIFLFRNRDKLFSRSEELTNYISVELTKEEMEAYLRLPALFQMPF
jgi:hypothetical protein